MKKKNDLMWSLSLLTIGAATVILVGSNVIGAELPDTAARIIGIIDLAALPILVYSSVKKFEKGQR